MPKTKFQEFIFTLITSGCIIFIMGVYNVAIHTGNRKEGAVEGRLDNWGEVVQGSRIGRCGWITSFLRKSSREFFTVELSIDNSIFLVAMRFWETPVLIPNTMVKT